MEESKKNSHKGFVIFIILFLVISIIFLRKENQNKIIKFIDSFGDKEKALKLIDSIKYNDDINNVGIYEGNIVKMTDDKIFFMKPDGTIILEKEVNFTESFIHYGEKYIYLTDKTRGDITFFDKNGDVKKRLQLNKEIFNVKEINQNLIYHTKSSKGDNINILDKNGTLVANHSFEDKNILTYATNKKATKNVVSILELDEQILKSQILFFGETNESIGSLDIEGEIILFLGYTSKDEIVALTDSALYLINDSKTIWKKQFNLIKDIYIEDKIYILYGNTLESINMYGITEDKSLLTDEYKKILPFDGKILLYGDNNISIVDGDKEILKENENLIGVSVSNRQFLIWGKEEIKTYQIINKKE